jgi:hypothetical protein
VIPIVAIGGAISAVSSVIKGINWLSDQLDSSKSTTSAAGAGMAAQATAIQPVSFATTLAAQTAGQSVPAVTPAPTTPAASSLLAQTHGTDYDALARMKAGVMAYNHNGDHHHHNHPDAATTPDTANSAAAATV